MHNYQFFLVNGLIDRFKLIEKEKCKTLLIYLLSSFITAAVGLICNPFLSIGLNHRDYAIIGYFGTITWVFGQIINFSLTTYYARNYHLLDDKKRNELLQTILSFFWVIGFVIFILFFVVYYFYHMKYVGNIPFNPYAILSFLPSYFSLSYTLYLLDLRMQNKAKRFALLSVSNSLLNASISILLVYIYPFGAIGRLSSLLIVALLFGFYSNKMEHFHFYMDFKILKKAYSFCWPITISSVLSFFFLGLDRTFLARLNNIHDLGLYNVGIQISSYLHIFNTVLLQTFDPDLFKYTSLKQHRKVALVLAFLIVLVLIPNICFIILSEPLISLLTANRYTDAAPFARILCLNNVATMFAYVLSGILLGYGYSKYDLYTRTLGAVISIFIYYYFIKYFGFWGAAWGQSISWFLMGIITLLCLFYLHKKRQLN